MSEKVMPFGLLFEEPALSPGQAVEPFYSEATDISYIWTEQGQRIPYVEFKPQVEDESAKHTCLARGTGTQTETKVKDEQTDQDPLPSPPRPPKGTETFTFIEVEITKSDR